MHNIVLFEDGCVVDMLPLTYWRTLFELRVGRKILLDRTAQKLELPVSGVWVRDWFAPVAQTRCGAPVNQPLQPGDVLVSGRWMMPGPVDFGTAPCVGVVNDEITESPEIAFVHCDDSLAHALNPSTMLNQSALQHLLEQTKRAEAPGWMVRYPWDVTSRLPDLLRAQWRASDAIVETPLDDRVVTIAPDCIHIGERTTVHPTATIDATDGPVYVSHDVTIGAYAVVDGPAYIGPGTRINPHAWLHGGNAIGPICRVGGEVDGCVLHGYTNKQHAGFLGHSYVGSWVNIGAGATNSDLKNTYGNVRVPIRSRTIDSGQMFFGAVIGDHAKIGINVTIPTGAVIGMAASVATSGACPKFVPSFAWVTDGGIRTGDVARLLDVATTVMARRQVDMTDAEVELFLNLPHRARELERAMGHPKSED